MEIIEKPFENLLKLKYLEVSGNPIKYFNQSLKINAEFINIYNFKFELRYFHNYNKSLTEEELKNFYGKDIISNFGTLYTVNSNCFESIELWNKDYKRLKKSFKWENKYLKRLIAIIGLNGVGKTSLLELIDKSISKEHINFISKYFDSANQKLKINHGEYSQLNRKLRAKAAEINSKNDFIDFVYQSINDFSLLQSFDYLLLIGYNYDDFNKIDKNLFHYEFSEDYIKFRQAEQNYFLYRIEDKSKELSNTYYAVDKQNEFQSIEHYLKVNKDHKLSPGEYLILLIQLWIIHANKEQKNVKKKLRILLLDEPDTYMHPKLIKSLISFFQSDHLNFLNLNIIMTTHNPVTVNFLDKENIYELKYDKETDQRSIDLIENKSNIIRNLSDNLFYIKEKFKIVYVEGEKKEDKAFYEFVFNLKTNRQTLLPVKFVEMGGKKFNQLFRIDQDISDDNKLDEFLFGINDGDYLIEEARNFFHITDEYDYIDNYQENFKRLNRYCMENYIYDPVNISFALNNFIRDKNLEKNNSNGLYDCFVDFIQKIKNFQNINDFIRNEKDYKNIFNKYLKDFNSIFIKS